MPKLNHIASIALDPQTVGKFYATVFDMTFSRSLIGATAREGYVGLNFNPLWPGRPGPIGLDAGHTRIKVQSYISFTGNRRRPISGCPWFKSHLKDS